MTNNAISQNTLSLHKWSLALNLSATDLHLIMAMSGASNSSGAITIKAGVYTMSGSTASLASSASAAITWSSGSATSASSLFGGVSGTRYRTLSLGTFAFTPGDYMMAFLMSTSNAGTWSYFGQQAVSIVGALNSNETARWIDGISTSSTSAFPASINLTDTNYVRTGNNPLRQPGFILIGTF